MEKGNCLMNANNHIKSSLGHSKTASKRMSGCMLLMLCIFLSMVINVQSVNAASPKLSSKQKKIAVGQTFTLQLKNYKGKKSIKWTTSNKSVAKLKKVTKTKYKITGKKAGKATITAKVGSKKYKCVVTVEDEKHTHTYKLEKTVDATCQTEGYDLYKCSCGATEKRNIETGGHTYKLDKTVGATCQAEGYDLYKCATCGVTKKRNITEIAEHNYKLAETVDATCQTEGYDLYKCSYCGVAKKRNLIEAAEHNYKLEEKVAATCQAEGYDLYKCAVCGATKKSHISAKTEHNGKWIIEKSPAENSKGKANCICDDCNKIVDTKEVTIDDYYSYVFRDGGVVIDKYKGDGGELTIPSTIEGKQVIGIGDDAFRGYSSLTSIIIPDGVTSIGSGAFNRCSNLTSINIPDGVTSIDGWAFYECSSLTSIIIPDGVTSIGYSAFSGCSSLTSIIIPNSVTSIGGYAFSGCSSLTSIIIPNSVTSIEGYAFSGCSSLTSITIPLRTGAGEGVFDGCKKLTIQCYKDSYAEDRAINENISYKSIEANMEDYFDYTITDDSKVTIQRYYGMHKSLEIPSTIGGKQVRGIGGNAFSYCSRLTSVTIPNSVTSIGYEAFYGCSRLTSVTIPNSVTSIGNEAFYGCSSLTNITIPDSATSIGWDAFKGCNNLTIHGYVGSYAESYANNNDIPFVAIDG